MQRFCGGKRQNSGSSHCTLGLLLCHIFRQINSISNFLFLFSVAISLLANLKGCSLYCDYANDLLCTFVNNALALFLCVLLKRTKLLFSLIHYFSTYSFICSASKYVLLPPPISHKVEEDLYELCVCFSHL